MSRHTFSVVVLVSVLACATVAARQEMLPRPGEFWCIKETKEDRNDPFPVRLFTPATIREVRSGWVRYSDNGLRDDVRVSLKDFTAVYTRCAEQSVTPQPRQ